MQILHLANASNVFTGTVTFTTDTGSDISIADTTAFDLGALAVNSLIVSAGGDISDSGVLDIATTASFTTTAANGNVVLDQASDIDGALSITTHGTGTSSVTNLTDAIELGTITSAQLTVAAGGDITQSGAATITGDASFSAGGNVITLNSEGNDFTGAVSLTNTGTNNITIDDANDLVLGTVSIAAGNLNVDNAGTITQNGVVSVGGNTVLDNSDGDNADITLANESNVFTGTVTFTRIEVVILA